jgi:hypothetical protein
MTKLRPYIAIDLETTGLDTEKSQILQIGWVIDDGVSPRKELQTGSILIQNDSITYGENYAIGMNAWIFQELMKKPADRKYPTRLPQAGILELMIAIDKAAKLAHDFDVATGVKRPSKKTQIAGKNAGNFDWPIIMNTLKNFASGTYSMEHEANQSAIAKTGSVDHRFIDCGAVYFDVFGKNPSFNDINTLIGNTEISHDALDDAMDVVIALRNKLGIKE